MRVLATVRLPSGMRFRLADLEEYEDGGPYAVEGPATNHATGEEVWLAEATIENYGLAMATWAAYVGSGR